MFSQKNTTESVISVLFFELSSICSSLPFIFWAVDLPPTKRSTSNRIDQQALALHGAPPRLPRRSVLLSPLLPRARDAPRHSPSPDAFAFSSGDRLRSVLLRSRRALKRQNDRALGRVVAPSRSGWTRTGPCFHVRPSQPAPKPLRLSPAFSVSYLLGVFNFVLTCCFLIDAPTLNHSRIALYPAKDRRS